MKVIEKGTGQKGWAKKLTCTGTGNGDGGCKAVLLVEEDDLYAQYSSSMGETTTYVSFRCCECGVETDVYRDDIPTTGNAIPGEVAKRVINKKKDIDG